MIFFFNMQTTTICGCLHVEKNRLSTIYVSKCCICTCIGVSHVLFIQYLQKVRFLLQGCLLKTTISLSIDQTNQFIIDNFALTTLIYQNRGIHCQDVLEKKPLSEHYMYIFQILKQYNRYKLKIVKRKKKTGNLEFKKPCQDILYV